ncbi:nematocyst expressed protein 3-like [Ctenopharyngodon idella]|uniref:nematocyst expressed protein 3-like n=1 Tax=Ctenopharyngodon idella TaxID=7959 RepID=UPI00222F1824|nr:nematocyst expressed protein 3-like [Ctenopharyngodon idella]
MLRSGNQYDGKPNCNRRTDHYSEDISSTMGIFLVPIPPVVHKTTNSAVDCLWRLRQDGRPLERYMEEFSELSCLVGWPDAPLNACFLKGLDEDTICYIEPACSFSLVESINLILFLNGSDFEIEEVLENTYPPRPAPSETHAAWSVHLPPVSSTYPSSGSSHLVVPIPKPTKKTAAAKTKPPKKMATAASESRHEMAAAKPKPPKKMVAAASESCHGMAAAMPKPPRKMAAAASESCHEMATAKPKPSPEEDQWLIDFWTEPVTPVLREPAPVLREPAPVLREPAPVLREPAPVPAPVLREPAPVLREPAPVPESSPDSAPVPELSPDSAPVTEPAPDSAPAHGPLRESQRSKTPGLSPKYFFFFGGGRLPVP